MRLKQIKLSGFKSFVDPTAFQIPSQLVGVVGPNGCGKSNVMDAVRWVLGESKASELRGESMQDVIFSGSSERKPAARASVELVFDNSLGRIGGSWAGYAEISVRRTLGRDNQSVYHINNQTVRRRDVHDMFLGTGLGPRAYAIIGQGTVSRIIEAKPDELRVFLEEAAGVSKYKERRRETENRLAGTRENLVRVEDIDRELTAQIERLTQQAEVAASYREMEQERTLKQRVQWIVRRNDARNGQDRAAASAAAAQTALESRTADLRSAENRAEAMREQHREVGNEVHEAQGQFYEANANVSRLESELRRIIDTQTDLQSQQERLTSESDRLRNTADTAERERMEATESLATIEAALSEGEIATAAAEESLEQAQERLQQNREQYEAARSQHEESRRELEIRRTEIQGLNERAERLGNRQQRAQQQLQALESLDDDSIHLAQSALTAAVAQESTAQATLMAAQEQWDAIEAQRMPAQAALREAEARQAQIEARIAALEDLQQRLDRQTDMTNWLNDRGLGGQSPLWERFRIQDGWETAIETVLRERVAAVEVESVASALALVDAKSPPSKLVLFAQGSDSVQATKAETLKPLASMARSGETAVQQHLNEWLAGFFVADSLTDAMQRQDSLPPGAAFIVRDGHQLTASSVRWFEPDSEREGVLQRQRELENLEREKRAQSLLVTEARQHVEGVEASAVERTRHLNESRSKFNQLAQALSAAQIAAQRTEQQVAQWRSENDRLQAELSETSEQLLELESAREQAQARADALQESGEAFDESVSALREATEQAEHHLAEARARQRQVENDLQAKVFEERATRERVERLALTITESGTRHDELRTELASIQERLSQMDTSALEEERQSALELQSEREQALSMVRNRQDELSAELKAADEARLRIEREREPLSQQVSEAQLKEQAARLAVVQFQEQLDEVSIEAEAEPAMLASFDEPPRASWLASEVTRLNRAIDALGPVNLAALDELKESSERKGFLDSQSADLNEAIATLEDAIHRIDMETRELLQKTFDAVNLGFGRLFPELFGGGDAKLVLTGEEILDAGVQVMAHPPGKRNTSIHLLSGGEKALTAIALVFALFQLNPAPFCLLDEVDAPLDDANTERYRNMVTRMSEQTQFLFITHNKIAMEMAQQLIGVTMQEQGVSRIVAVDLDAASEFAEAA
ncbi:MAG: chromosome segregation protein SMC [Burkholderiaceae bacterium]